MTLLSSFNVAVEGLDVCSRRIQTSSENVANTGTPYYVRKIPIISSTDNVTFQGVLSDLKQGVFHTGLSMMTNGVEFDGNALDPTPGKRVYAPGHPQADKDGYITLSNVNVVSDMADATMASRLYEANLSVIGVVKQMANRALEIGK